MFIALGVNNSQFDNIEFDLNGSARVGIHLAATNTINTTLRTAVSHGTATVAPGTMANITVGTVLNVGRGTNMEPVYVTATTSSTFTAAFAKSHGTNDPVGGSAGSSGVKFSNLTVTDVPIASTTFDSDQLNSTAAIEIGKRIADVGRTPTPADELRQLRAIVVLERLGGDVAKRVLKLLAAGPTESRVTTEAQAALRRLG